MKKILAILVICIAAMMVLPVNGLFETFTSHEAKRAQSNALVTPITLISIPTPKALEKKESSLPPTRISLQADIPIAESESPETHPTLAVDGSRGIFGGYALQTDFFEQDIIYTYSADEGATWEALGSLNLEGLEDYPAIDYWGSGTTYVGTFRGDPTEYDGAAQYILTVEDPTDRETWSLTYFDWTSYEERDRESPDIAGYSDVGDATWWYGVIAETTSIDYEDFPGDHVPVLDFPNYVDENSGWAWWWNSFENAAHACIDIDRSSGVMYAAWDQFNESTPEKGRDILFAVADVHDWWEENWVIEWNIIGGSEENTYPDIAAENGYVYIVSQTDVNTPGQQDIVCYYSHDGGATWEMSTIAAESEKDELFPSIVGYGDGASCTFVVDGNLYTSHTNDGGVTWSAPVTVNDEAGTVSSEYRTAKVTTSGHTFWTDTRNGNDDVYYDNVGAPGPILSIVSVSGGFGVKATVTNSGTVSADNVEWSMVFDGPVFIGKEKSGTVTVPAGGEVTVSSGFIFGIGSASVTVTVGGASKTASGFVLGPFVLGIR